MTYIGLLNASVEASLRCNQKPSLDDARGMFMWREMEALCLEAPDGAREPSAGAIFADAVADAWPKILDGATADDVLAGQGIWRQLMCRWPMGAYAAQAAAVLQSGPLDELDVFEVGSGVGNLARLVAHQARSWVRSDLRPEICERALAAAPSHPVEAYDVTEPGRPERADVVVAVNAAHCALDAAQAVRNMAGMVRGGGRLVLAEGAPRPGGVPWALTWCFGLLDGWWDTGGFRPREEWVRAMEDADLIDVGWMPLKEDGWDVGGVIVGHKRP